jgi:hypothetical protein
MLHCLGLLLHLPRWGQAHSGNVQYVLQPHSAPGALRRFHMTGQDAASWQYKQYQSSSQLLELQLLTAQDQAISGLSYWHLHVILFTC